MRSNVGRSAEGAAHGQFLYCQEVPNKLFIKPYLISGLYCHREVLGIHVHPGSVSQIWSHAIHGSELECLDEGHRKEVGLCTPKYLTGTPGHSTLVIKSADGDWPIASRKYKPALPTAKVEDALIGTKVALIVKEPFRPEEGVVLKEGLSVVDGPGVVVDLGVLGDEEAADGGAVGRVVGDGEGEVGAVAHDLQDGGLRKVSGGPVLQSRVSLSDYGADFGVELFLHFGVRDHVEGEPLEEGRHGVGP